MCTSPWRQETGEERVPFDFAPVALGFKDGCASSDGKQFLIPVVIKRPHNGDDASSTAATTVVTARRPL